MGWMELGLAGLAAIAAGVVNALAGGGTLITFPMLTAIGLPALAANVTNTVGLCPGFIGGTLAQSKDLLGQKGRLWRILPPGIVGGVAGGVLLMKTGERLFHELIPYLILAASGLLAIQNPLRNWVLRRVAAGGTVSHPEGWAGPVVGFASIYGGYFGAGLGVILLAALGLTIDDNLTRLNALKQAISFVVNTAAAIFFLFSGQVIWPVALIMAAGALLGGSLGGRLAGRIKPESLRWTVVAIGATVGVVYLLK